MVSGQALLIALIIGLSFFIGEETVKGIKWVGHEAKVGGIKVVHLIKHIPH